jgi:hypothetical protein
MGRLLLQYAERVDARGLLPCYHSTKQDLVLWGYSNLLGYVTCIDDELIWDREVHHEEFESLLPTDDIVLPCLGRDDREYNLPVVRIDEFDRICEDTIRDEVESIADRLYDPLPLQSIDGLCDTCIFAHDISSTRIDEITDILDCDDFSHFFLQLFDDFV